MKKLLALLLALAMVAAMFTGCGEPENDRKENSSNHDEDKDDNKKDDEDDKQDDKDGEDDKKPGKVTPEGTVIYDGNDVVITFLGLDESYVGREIELSLENKTDKDIILVTGEIIVNGITVPSRCYLEAKAGETVEHEITVSEEATEMAGIDTLAVVQCPAACIYEASSYDMLFPVPAFTLTLDPKYDQKVDDSGDVLLEKDGLTLISQGLKDHPYGGQALQLMVKNNSDKAVALSVENVSINGYTVDIYVADLVYPETVRFCWMEFDAADLEKNNITEIGDVTFDAVFMDTESYDELVRVDALELTFETSGQQPGESDTPADPNSPLAETVVYNDADVTITVTGLSEDNYDVLLGVRVENRTDKNITYSCDTMVINGLVVYASGYVEVAAGKKANDEIALSKSSLEQMGIEKIATIVCKESSVYDSDSYDTLLEVPEFTLTVDAGYVQTLDESGDVLLQQDGLTVYAQSIREDSYGQTVVLLVKNESDKDVTVEAEDVAVNGTMITCFVYDTVYSGTACYTEMNFYASELEENDIVDIEEVTFTLEISDAESYDDILELDVMLTVTE